MARANAPKIPRCWPNMLRVLTQHADSLVWIVKVQSITDNAVSNSAMRLEQGEKAKRDQRDSHQVLSTLLRHALT